MKYISEINPAANIVKDNPRVNRKPFPTRKARRTRYFASPIPIIPAVIHWNIATQSRTLRANSKCPTNL
jgi:hypothetical protein